MNNSTEIVSCSHFQKYFLFVPRNFYYENVLTTFFIINATIAVVSAIVNVLVIYTISRTASLRTPSNILILGLSISDLCSSVVSQPLFCASLYSGSTRQESLYCKVGMTFESCVWMLGPVSFLTLTAITADRFLAVHLHLRYQELVTTKRYGITLVLIWAFCALVSVCKILASNTATRVSSIILLVSILLGNAYFIFKISQVIRRHSVQIQAQQQSVQQSIDMPRYKKSVNTMYYVIGAFVVCYVPLVGSLILEVSARKVITLHMGYLFVIANTLVMFNGVLNPIIYCWRMKDMRNAARRLFQRMSTQNNTVTQGLPATREP